jgi:hypothetical protein
VDRGAEEGARHRVLSDRSALAVSRGNPNDDCPCQIIARRRFARDSGEEGHKILLLMVKFRPLDRHNLALLISKGNLERKDFCAVSSTIGTDRFFP